MTNSESSRAPQALSRAQFAERISASWQQGVVAAVAGFVETGRRLITAKASLDHGDFLAMVERDLPFSPRTAQRLMAIAADPRIANATRGSLFPPHWRTLYELTRLDNDQFESRISDGTINPEMERRDIETVVKRERRTQREPEVQAALPYDGGGPCDYDWHNPPAEDFASPTEMYLRQTEHYLTEAMHLASALPLLRVEPSKITKANILAVSKVAQAWQKVAEKVKRRTTPT